MAVIFTGKSFDLAALMLKHAAGKMVGEADVQSAGGAADDVNPVPVLPHRGASKQHRNADEAGVFRLGRTPSLNMTPNWE